MNNRSTVDVVVRDVEGRIVVEWPNGRGQVLVAPEVVEGWAAGINLLRDQAADLEREIGQADTENTRLRTVLDEQCEVNALLSQELGQLRRLVGEAIDAGASNDGDEIRRIHREAGL